jgi:Zn-dependent protease
MPDLAARIQEFAVVIPVFLLALTIHEFAHAWVATRLGDPTARLQGRLTLNPLAHLDPIGTLAIVLIRFGWAKPVPVDSRYLENPRRDMVLIAAAGPASNLLLAAACAFCYRMIPWGATGLEWAWIAAPVRVMLRTGVLVNVVLAVFNLLPVPPLDGGRVLSGLLPLRQAISFSRLEPYGFLIIFFLFFTGIMDPVFGVAVRSLTLVLFRMWG